MSDDPEITDPRDPMKRRDVVAELDRYLVRDETVGFTEMVQRARHEIVALRGALEESVKLQRHYALLLNDYDGGKRIPFESAEAWMERLRALKEKRLNVFPALKGEDFHHWRPTFWPGD